MTRRRIVGALLATLSWTSACGPGEVDPDASASTPTIAVSAEALSRGQELMFGAEARSSLPPDRRARFAALESESTRPPELSVDVKTGAVLTLALAWTPRGASTEETALRFAERYQLLLDPRVSAAEYRVPGVKSPCPASMVTLNRVVGGQQVIGSRLTFHFDATGHLVFVTNAVAPVPGVVKVVADPYALTKKAVPLAKLMGKVPFKAAQRVPVMVPMPDGSGVYKGELASWFNGQRYRGAVVIGAVATSGEFDASGQGIGRSTGAAPRVSAGHATDVPSQVAFRDVGGAHVASLEGERNPLESAYRFLDEHPTLFRTGVARCQFSPTQLRENPTVPGVFMARLAQHHGSIPVFGSELVVRLEGLDTVQNVMGRTRGSVDVAPSPGITAADATDAAVRMLRDGATRSPAQKPAVDEAAAATPRTELVILPGFLSRDLQSKNDRLAWKVDVGPFTVLVDAATRAVLWTVTSRPEASVVRDARGANEFGYLGYTEVEVDGVPRAGAPTPNADVSSTRLGGGVGASLARMQAMLARNGWLGLNGRCGNLVANTNVNLSGGRCQNAFFDSTFTNSAFFCLGIASADVVGHEFTHGVVAHSSGLLYADQSGAINEAYADLFGNLMDSSPGWLVGEQTTSGALRDMLNPSALGDPNHMSRYQPRTSACGPWPWDCDAGGVHSNSGILNRAHATLADGIAGAFAGIGRERLERLAFFVMTSQLPSSATLNQVAGATRDVCDMFVARRVSTPSGLTFTAAHCDAVTNAFNSVGLNPSLSVGWAEPTLGFSGSETLHAPGADGRFPLTPGSCPVSNILLRHRVPVLGTTLFADYSPATPMASRTALLDWVATASFDFTGVASTASGPLPLGTPVLTHDVRWTSAYGIRPAYATDVQYPATCTPPPVQERTSNAHVEGFETGTWWGSATRTVGNAAPAALAAECTLLDSKLELVDGDGTTRIAGPGTNISHTVTHWFLFIPVNFTANASVVSAPVGRNLSGRVAIGWDLGRTVRVRWRHTFAVPAGFALSCNPR